MRIGKMKPAVGKAMEQEAHTAEFEGLIRHSCDMAAGKKHSVFEIPNQIYPGSIIFFVGLPPRNVLICYATLDRMEKQCCSFITDGEELKNNLLFLRQAT